MASEAPTARVRFVWFDQDDTLYDYSRAMSRSIAAVLRIMHERLPDTRDTIDAEALVAARRDVSERCGRAGIDLFQARRDSFAEAMARCSRSDDGLADELTDVYYDELQTNIRPFADTVPCLRALRRDYVLGVLSNGMDLTGTLGISDLFEHRLHTADTGLEKPAVEFFRLAERVAGARADECLLVGDSELADVTGAVRAGWRAIWLNRSGRPPRPECPPAHATVRDLRDLPRLVRGLGAPTAASGA